MTRNRELDLEDLFECNHEPETPIVDWTGEVTQWRCRCGQIAQPEKDTSQENKESK